MEELDEILEAEVVEEKENWFVKKKTQFVDFCKQHPDIVLTVIGGIASLAGGAMKLAASKNEYQDEVYMTDGDDVYKLPARQVRSKKMTTMKTK